MSKRKRKKTANQIEYAKQLNRIKNAVRRMSKRGYMFVEDILPQTPKRITKTAIQRLKEITPNALYRQATYVDNETGEILTGVEGRKSERKKASEKAKETRKRKKTKKYDSVYSGDGEYSGFATVVIANYKAHIRQFNEHCYNLLNAWLDRIIYANGEEDTATMLNDGASNGNIVTYKIAYSAEKLTQYITAMMDYLPEAGDIFKEQMLEAFETMEEHENPS